jgi:hypothetical protein
MLLMQRKLPKLQKLKIGAFGYVKYVQQNVRLACDFGFKNGEYFPNENEMDIRINDEITVSEEEDEEEDENNDDESPSEESSEESEESESSSVDD